MTASPISRRYGRYQMQRAASAAVADALKRAPNILGMAKHRRVHVLARRMATCAASTTIKMQTPPGDATRIVYPRLCWDTSSIAKGTLTYVFPGGPADANAWRQRLPDISAWLGQTWTMGSATANTLTLIRRPPLPETLPFLRSNLKPGALSSASIPKPTGPSSCHSPT